MPLHATGSAMRRFVAVSQATRDEQLAAYEHRFRRAGLPLLIEEFNAAEDVYTRAYPFLALVLFAELAAIVLDLPLYVDAAVTVAAFTALLVCSAAIRRRLGRAPIGRERIDSLELVAFVAAPAGVALLAGDGLATAAWLAVVNAALLAGSLVVIGAGLPAIVLWTLRNAGTQIAGSLPLLARALPLLLVFSAVLFLNTEMWQVAAASAWSIVGLVAGLLLGAAVLFLALRLPAEVRTLERQTDAEQLTRGQRLNVSLVLLVGQLIQLSLISLALFCVFVVLGALLIEPSVREVWIHTAGSPIVTFEIFGEPRDITEELVQVSGFTAALATLSFAISSATDTAYRSEFLDNAIENLRATFQAHAEYVTLRRESASPQPSERDHSPPSDT